MKKLLIIALMSAILTACGTAGSGTGASKLDVKVGGKDSTLNVKSTFVNYSGMAFTAPNKPNIVTSVHTIYLANYEMDTSSPAWTKTPLTAPDQMRVSLELTGEDGTKKESPFKVGTYSVAAENVNGLRFVKIVTFADGKQVETTFETMTRGQKASGEVKITAVTAETVSGEVNITEGDKAVKGTFTAKLPAANK